MILHEELKSFGLSQSEAKAYLALLGLREARASEISKLSSLPRNKIYPIMESLHKKGFAEIIPEKVTRFKAVPFDSALLLFLEENTKRLDEVQKAGERVANQLKKITLAKKSEVGEFTVYKSRRIIYKKLEEIVQSAKESVFLCMEASDLKRLHFLLKSFEKTVELSIITKIDRDSRALAKKWSAVFNVKHTENIPPAKIVIIDNREVFVFQTQSPIGVHCTDSSFISLIRSLADMLWNSSVQAKDKILELETGKPIEEIKYIHGRENFYKTLAERLRSTKKDLIIVTSSNGIIRMHRHAKDLMRETQNRNVRIRCITTLNKSNLDAAKDLGIEIRHIENIKVVLSCYDDAQLNLIQIKDDTPTIDSPDDVTLITTQKATVSTFRFILETMWEHARTLEARIQELETGKPMEEIRFIREEKSIYETTKEASSTAKKEICNISTEQSLERAAKFGTIDIDIDRAKSGVKLRYIYPITKDNLELVRRFMEFAEIRHTDSPPLRVRIIDDAKCLLRHGEEEFLGEKFCILSHAKDFISAMKVFFEKMWTVAIPAEERIRQLEREAFSEVEEAKKMISRRNEKFAGELSKV